MCRLVAYLGDPVLLEEVIVKPQNSIVMQSLRARESNEVPTNGDGFGLGWYAPEISEEPGLFTSIFPAWNDTNLLHLSAKIKSPCFFSHVRAASVGGINSYNCHPFIYKRWMFMHNGAMANFLSIKRHLRRLLTDHYYQYIQGETDSEHFFALLLQTADHNPPKTLHDIANYIQETIRVTLGLAKLYDQSQEASYFNLCLTDGKQLVACRYCSDPDGEAPSLHYLNKTAEHNFTIVASERLAHGKGRWHTVPYNHFVLIDKDLNIEVMPMETSI